MSVVGAGESTGLTIAIQGLILIVSQGITTDVFFYAIIIPVIPFRLEALGYDHPSSLTGYLLLAFAGGLLISTPPITYVCFHSIPNIAEYFEVGYVKTSITVEHCYYSERWDSSEPRYCSC